MPCRVGGIAQRGDMLVGAVGNDSATRRSAAAMAFGVTLPSAIRLCSLANLFSAVALICRFSSVSCSSGPSLAIL